MNNLTFFIGENAIERRLMDYFLIKLFTEKPLEKPGRKEKPVWVKQMAARRRKTLVVCRKCHEGIHAGTATASFRKVGTGEPDAGKLARPVREGGNEKGP